MRDTMTLVFFVGRYFFYFFLTRVGAVIMHRDKTSNKQEGKVGNDEVHFLEKTIKDVVVI